MRFGFLFLLLIGWQAHALAQQPRFRAAVVGGLNAAQIDGDDLAGYNKPGLRGGLRAITYLSPKSDLVFDILYSERGSRRLGDPTFGSFDNVIRLQYIEVPVMYTIKDWLDEESDYYRVQAYGGLVFSRLFSSNVLNAPPFDEQQDNFNQFSLGFTLGAAYNLSDAFSIGIHFNRNLTWLYNNLNFRGPGNVPIYDRKLLEHYWTLQGVYAF